MSFLTASRSSPRSILWRGPLIGSAGSISEYLVPPPPPPILLLIEVMATSCIRAAPTSRFSIRSEEHTSEVQSLMRISYADFCLQKKNKKTYYNHTTASTT